MLVFLFHVLIWVTKQAIRIGKSKHYLDNLNSKKASQEKKNMKDENLFNI